MGGLVSPEIERYCAEHSPEESELFQQLVLETRASTERPNMQVGRLEGAFLRLLARLCRAERVLEIGTFTGYSALAMAEALPRSGTLVTLDVDPKATAIARAAWKKSPHGRKIELKLGPALESIPRLRGAFDLVFIDADKTNYIRYWEACLPKVRRGGLLVADNVLWSGRVLRPQGPEDHALAAFGDHVRRDRRVEAVMLPVRDGIYLARKL